MEDVRTEKQKAKEITDKLEEGLKEFIEEWDGTKGLKVLESSLDTIRRIALELLAGMENQLREMRRGEEQIQRQGKESLLLIQP